MRKIFKYVVFQEATTNVWNTSTSKEKHLIVELSKNCDVQRQRQLRKIKLQREKEDSVETDRDM